MIVPMMKTTIVCLNSDRQNALENLGRLGVLHVKLETMPAASAQRQQFEQQIAAVEKTCATLLPFAGAPAAGGVCGSPSEIVKKVAEQDELRADCAVRQDALLRQRKALEPWGDFDPATVAAIRQGGVKVAFCLGTPAQLEAATAEYTTQVICEDKGKCYFVVFSPTSLDDGKLPLAILPENTSLSQIDREVNELASQKASVEDELRTLAAAMPKLREYRAELQEKLEFQTNCEGMGQAGELAYISGFVPQPDLKKLKDAAARYGWALQAEAADRDDHAVPTLVVIPKLFRVIEPMIKFLGISPGYNETDVSGCILFFLTIFFGMIVGDAGYGTLFLVVAAIAWFKFTDPKIRLAIKMLVVFSIATVIWGGLSGAWFGIEVPGRPRFFKGIEWLTDEHVKDAHIQLICFTLAIAHLTIGRLWRAVLRLNSVRWLMTQLGWICILWGNYFIALKLLVMPGAIPTFVMYLYIAGAALIMVFGIHWHELGEIFEFPFGVIGSFVDILSYIRLFAVGMSGAYIASSFNGMAGGLFHQSSLLMTILGSTLAVIILLGGHGVNLALAGMGVLVHGVRLNVLEFSNHVGLGWGGHPYQPFRITDKGQMPASAGAIAANEAQHNSK